MPEVINVSPSTGKNMMEGKCDLFGSVLDPVTSLSLFFLSSSFLLEPIHLSVGWMAAVFYINPTLSMKNPGIQTISHQFGSSGSPLFIKTTPLSDKCTYGSLGDDGFGSFTVPLAQGNLWLYLAPSGKTTVLDTVTPSSGTTSKPPPESPTIPTRQQQNFRVIQSNFLFSQRNLQVNQQNQHVCQ